MKDSDPLLNEINRISELPGLCAEARSLLEMAKESQITGKMPSLLPLAPEPVKVQTQKPLFIPLKGKFFEDFEEGRKDTEYRLRGPRWNAETCAIGRAVVLSLGYGKQRRLKGVITGFHYDTLPERIPGWMECYGRHAGDAACIRIKIEKR
jgi:hypothetical protein